MNKPPRIEANVRAQISRFLPFALDAALASYQRFVCHDNATKLPEFSAHHGAAKVALGHIHLLMKLLPWANETDQNVADRELAALFAEAEAELAGRIHEHL